MATGLLTTCLLLAISLGAAELRIQVSDQTNRPVWSRIEVRGASGTMYQPPGALIDKIAANRPGGEPWYKGGFVIRGECRLEAPPGRYTVVAEHGLEYQRVEQQIEVRDTPAQVSLVLKPWIRMRERGWYSGDLHVHRTVEDAPSLALAEDLNLSAVFTMWNKRNLWDSRPQPADPVIRASDHHLVTVMNAEDERGGGAWMLHGLPRPLALAVDGRWYPAGIRFVEQARAMRRGGVFPWFDSEKPIWWELPVMMALATPDSFGLLHNHFNQYGIYAQEAWGRPRDQERFAGPEGFVNYSLGLYYRYLNLGFRVPPSAGSASGVLPNPVGYNRVYVPLQGAFTAEAWYRALREGKGFVTNGPMLFIDVTRKGSKMRVSAEAQAREPIDRLELVANGRVLDVRHSEPSQLKIRGQFVLEPAGHSWAAVRCFLKPGATIRLAHSSPIYLDGNWDAREDARYFADWIDELVRISREDPKRFASDAEREEVLGLYRRARAFYEEKMKP